MKTTIERAAMLLDLTRKRATRDWTTLRGWIATAISRFLRPPVHRARRFRLRDGSVPGNGLGASLREGD